MKSAALIISSTLLGLVILFFINILPDDQYVQSLIFVAYYILAVYSLWIITGERLNLFFLFFLTFGLFIGGRFFAIFLTGTEYNIWEPTFYYDYYVPLSRRIEIFRYVIGFMCFSVLGYGISHTRNHGSIEIQLKPTTILNIDHILRVIFPILAFLTIYDCIQSFISALSGGYLASYIEVQNSDYKGTSLISTLSYVLFGLAVGYGQKTTKKRYIILFIIKSLFDIAIGGRGSFGVTLLILLWFYSMKHRISLKKLLICCVCCAIILLFVFSFSIRAVDIDNETSILDAGSVFLYTQGVSLMVFDASRLIDSYPVIPYFQSLIPGVAVLYSVVTGNILPATDVAFPSYMCSQLNPQLWSDGYGLGWTLMSDLYLYSNRQFIGFLLLSLLWGFIIGKLDIHMMSSRFIRALGFTIAYPFLTLPRGGLNSIIPLIWYFVITFLIVLLYSQIKNKLINN